MQLSRVRRSGLLGLLAVATLAGATLTGTASGSAATPTETRTPYVNPVSKTIPADTFADPSIIRGKDGYWYSYGTSDPLCEETNPDRAGCTAENGYNPHRIPIAKSSDMVTWKFAGDAFADPGPGSNFPSWAEPNAGLWGPDIRYVNGQYRLYYVVTETKVTPEPNDNAIGMATAPTPIGPWTDSGGPVVGPRRGGQVGDGNFKWTFDPAVVTDTDGSQWMFYGSYYGGVWVTKLTDDGRTAVGDPTMVAIDNKFEGSYVVRRGGYWYFFGSTANCCAGPTTGYSVQVGRSRDLRGPYIDRDGVSLVASRAGGTPTLNQNGNAWIGAGHNAIATDLAGQDWIVYHAINRGDPYLNGTDGINERPMLMDRLDWLNGWPYVRDDLGPSDTPQAGPVSGGATFTRFDSGTGAFRPSGSWTFGNDPQSGRFAEARRNQSTLTATAPDAHQLRAEADVRGSAGITLGARHDRPRVQVFVASSGTGWRLRAEVTGGPGGSLSAALPANFNANAWHSLAIELRGNSVYAELTNARLGDPLATLTMQLRRGLGDTVTAGAVARKPGADVDNLSVLKAYTPVTHLATHLFPTTLDPAASDEFNGATWNSGWTFVDRNPVKPRVADGNLVWPVEDSDLNGCNTLPGCTASNANLLLREPPSQTHDWAIQTKLTLDTGTDEVLNFQQGGLVVYVNDDLFTRLSNVAIWDTRQTEFGKEMPYAGRTSNGGTIVGPPGATTYLRIVHHYDAATNEHQLRAWTMREGGSWVHGGVWTLPGNEQLKVGLVSQGRQTGDRKTSVFDYFRAYTD